MHTHGEAFYAWHGETCVLKLEGLAVGLHCYLLPVTGMNVSLEYESSRPVLPRNKEQRNVVREILPRLETEPSRKDRRIRVYSVDSLH